MKHILSNIIVLFILLTSSVGWGESITTDDLVQRNDLYYKKFTNDPFTGEIYGVQNGSFKYGKKNSEWFSYYKNGQLETKNNYKDGVGDGVKVSD